MKKIILILIIASLSGLFVTSCSEESKSEGSKEEQLQELLKEKTELEAKIAELKEEIGSKDKPIPVETMDLSLGDFSHFVTQYGEVESDQDVDMSPKANGIVQKVYVEEGRKVNKGQTLALLDNDMLMKRVKELNDSYEYAKTIFEKQKRVWEKNVGSEVEYLQAKNNLESLENRMELLKEEVANTRIKAPFSGVIDKVYIKEGQMASPSMPAFRIVSQSDLKIRTDVAESVSYKLSEGSEAKVYFPDLNLDTLNLKISAISEGIDRVNRTVSVYVNLPKSVYKKVKPAMLASVRYKTAKIDSALTIPTNLIQKEGTTDFVFVVSKNEKGKPIADKKIIVTGKSFNGVTEVEGGITSSDKLITVGYENLREGSLIKY